MRKSRVFLNLGLLLVAALLVWRFGNISHDFAADRNSTPVQTSSVSEITAERQAPSLSDSGQGSKSNGVLLPLGVNSEDVEISNETGVITLVRLRPEAEHLQPPPEDVLPAGAQFAEVEISPETGVTTLSRLHSNADDFEPQPIRALPPGVRPEDVEISKETGAATLLRQRPIVEDSKSQASNALPAGVDPGDIEISPQTGVATLLQQLPSFEDSQPSLTTALPDDLDTVTTSSETGVPILVQKRQKAEK